MRDFPSRIRCVAPVRARAGVLCCVLCADRCTYPTHRQWRRFAWPMRLVWWIKPWWPNAIGRAMDKAGRGHAINERMDDAGGAA